MSSNPIAGPPMRPIKPPPKPGQVKVYRALYDYAAQRSDELSFSEGDMIYILDMISDKSWFKAKIGANQGLVPSNYSNFFVSLLFSHYFTFKHFTIS